MATGSSGRVYLALGSNLGTPSVTLLRAFARLSELAAGPVQRSSLWASEPMDCPPGSPIFTNAAAAFAARPDETPESLLKWLKQLEIEFGRKPKTRVNEPRPLDLDIIAFGKEVRQTPELTLPHPRAHLRNFVLAPLCEINPDLKLPGFDHSVRELLQSLPAEQSLRRVPDPINRR